MKFLFSCILSIVAVISYLNISAVNITSLLGKKMKYAFSISIEKSAFNFEIFGTQYVCTYNEIYIALKEIIKKIANLLPFTS